jgi:Protein of unknown function (DUF669)
LSDADTSGFQALEPGRYNAEIFELTLDAVKNTRGEGKLPTGTPMIKVQWRLTEDNDPPELENRRVFQQMVIPPDNYEKRKAQIMKGMIANFFIALGVPEEEVRSKKFDPMSDPDEYIGRPAVIVVARQQKLDGATLEPIEGEFNNVVKGVKPAGEAVSTSSGLL